MARVIQMEGEFMFSIVPSYKEQFLRVCRVRVHYIKTITV